MGIDLSRLHDKKYRLNNFYHIIDKNGNSILFRMNAVQNEVHDSLHNKNLILKARQLGMSTYSIIYLLDEVIFNHYTSAGIVSYSLPHGQHIFKNIVGHALDKFPNELRPLGITSQSTKEINFSNGSNFRVDTSLRGGTTQLVLITEFGKICARSPVKADEIMAGTLESVPLTGMILIESTGEGTSGPFAEMCVHSAARGNDNITEFDYKLHFFPWYTDTAYTTDSDVELDIETIDYFRGIEKELGFKFTSGQKAWYYKKKQVLKDKVQQEYPSTIEESFISNSDAFYYAKALQDARSDGRLVQNDLYDPQLPVFAAMDIAVTDHTVITFFQIQHGERRIIDSYGDTNKGVAFYANFMLKDKPYLYDTIFLPHDAVKKDGLIVENSYRSEFTRLFAHTGTKIAVLPRTDRNAGIGNAINCMRHCVFNERKNKDLIAHLNKYRKKWSEQLSKYLDEPLHDLSSDFADSFRYAMQGADRVEKLGSAMGGLQRHRDVVANRYKRI